MASPEEAREYIGFKHINGPHKWDAIAKAHFAAEWYRKERSPNSQQRPKNAPDL